MISELLIYDTADRLIEHHGDEAMKAVNRLLSRALESREEDDVLALLRVRLAVAALQAARSGPLN
jgi:hypothetical protein